MPEGKTHSLTNAEIADQLLSLARLLSERRENPYTVKAYRSAAMAISNMKQSVEELVRKGEDLTAYPGIGDAIESAIREIVFTGSLRRLEALRTKTS